MYVRSTTVALVALLSQVHSHGLVTSIQGSNGVIMPGLGVLDGTPRDCSTPQCGAENDTPVFKNKNGPLGASKEGGQITAAQGVAQFMGQAGAATQQTDKRGEFLAALEKALANKVADADNAAGVGAASASASPLAAAAGAGGGALNGALLSSLGQGLAAKIEGGAGGATGAQPGGASAGNGAADTRRFIAGKRGLLQLLQQQQAQQNDNGNDATPTKTPPGTVEDGVAQSAGKGAQSGLPTVGQNGTINLNFHQVNADGAGPYTAAVDPTSGGTNEAAFQPAQMTTNVPGRNSLDNQNKASDMQLQVQMPAGMNCTGTVAGQKNVCVVRIQNSALAGPFGGSAVFQQEGNQGSSLGATTSGAAAAAATPSAATDATAAASPAVSSPAAIAASSDAAGNTGVGDSQDAQGEQQGQEQQEQQERRRRFRFARA